MTESEILLLGLICTLIGVVIGALTTAAYLQSRYRDIRKAVGKGSLEGLSRLLEDESLYIKLLGDALHALDHVQGEVSMTRESVAQALEWIENTATEFEALRGLYQMPPTLKNDSPARRDFGRA